MKRAAVWLLAMSMSTTALAEDWSRFRGPNGSGVAADAKGLPSSFSATENLRWKVPLAGPGSSSPIVVGNKVLVTCWSGYGISREEPGDMKGLKLHLICVDRESGKQLWDKAVDAHYPEEKYQGMFAEHGYASHTPVSDGQHVYVYFGKTGLFAFDMEGKEQWRKMVGTGVGMMGWGSSSSPILYKDLVIVTASAESQALVAFNKKTGEQVWKQQADGLQGTWGTPILVKVDDARTDLVIGVPSEVWGLNPDNGKLRWYCEAVQENSFCSSVVASGDMIYAIEGQRGGGSFAIKAGGKDDVTKSHLVWSGSETSRIGTPVVADNKIYFISRKVFNCIDAATGKEIYKARLNSSSGTPQPPAEGGPFGRGGRGGGGQDYSSPVVGDGKLYYVARNGEIFVVKLGSSFEQISSNRLTDETEDFSASPAISDKQIFIRSSKHLYCLEQK